MSDYRKIEIVACVIGIEENTMTNEERGKIVPLKKIILTDENYTVEDIAKKLVQAIDFIESTN